MYVNVYNIKNSFDIIFFWNQKFSKVYISVGSNSVCEFVGLSELGYPNHIQKGLNFSYIFHGKQTWGFEVLKTVRY